MMDEFGISYLDLGLMFTLYSLPNLFMPFVAGVRELVSGVIVVFGTDESGFRCSELDRQMGVEHILASLQHSVPSW